MASTVTRLYQAVLRDQSVPISTPLLRTFSDWVTAKGFPPADGEPKVESEVDGARLTMERHGGCGRYTLEEPRGEGHLCTRVTYAESVPGMTGWVVVTMDRHGEGAGGGERSRFPPALPAHRADHRRRHPCRGRSGRPRRGRRAAFRPHDDRAPPEGADRGRLRGPPESRRGPGPRRLPGWRHRCASLVVQLTDLRAQDRFNKAMGRELGVFGGGIRTYLAPSTPPRSATPTGTRPWASPRSATRARPPSTGSSTG
ncbi:hypothetical protein ACFQX6_55055 [Streptosporangium lutulentum]